MGLSRWYHSATIKEENHVRPRFVLLLLTMVFSAFVSVVLIGQKPIVLAQRDKIQNLLDRKSVV